MRNEGNEILRLLDEGDHLNALKRCEELVSEFMTSFMEELTVNTATDYVGSVILYAKICAIVKKPWKAFPKLESARGALRFLKDYMIDRETLAETHVSFADAYAHGCYFPEAVQCYFEAANFFESKDLSLDALSSAFFYQARFGKELLVDLGQLEEKYGSNKILELKDIARKEVETQIKTDPVEATDAFLKIRYQAEEATDAIVSNAKENDLPFCSLYWNTKKSVLKDNFGIEWKTPAEMNPNIRFY